MAVAGRLSPRSDPASKPSGIGSSDGRHRALRAPGRRRHRDRRPTGRRLAITSPEAKGSFTEAGEVVGEITFDGTLAFLLFSGLPAGLITATLYAILRPILPGRTGGAILGAIVLLLVGTRIEPLRADNFDFDLVGPAWLAVLAFTALAVFQGMVTAALAGRVPGPAALTGRELRGIRVALAIGMLAFLPSFVNAVSDILG